MLYSWSILIVIPHSSCKPCPEWSIATPTCLKKFTKYHYGTHLQIKIHLSWRDKQEISFILDDREPRFSAIHPWYHYRRFSFNPLILPSFFASVSPPVPPTFAKKSLTMSQSCSQRLQIKPRQIIKSGLSARTFSKCHLENTRATKKKNPRHLLLWSTLCSQ